MSILDRKYNRSNFLKQEVYKGTPEYDLSEGGFNNFQVKDKVRLYQLDSYEAYRPDIISFRIYQNTEYWWILLKFNNIIDPFTELKPGLIIKVPSANDIQNFAKKNKKF